MNEIESFRRELTAIAYNMLGDYQEAKDVVQDSYESWLYKPRKVDNLKAYLTKMVVNQAIDRLKEAKIRREMYKGTWLPVPIVAPYPTESPALQPQPPDELSLAILHLMEKLNPVERAVLILREAFGYEYPEIAQFCEISAEHCRQLLHRAKEKLQIPKIRFPVEAQKHQQLLEAFLLACQHENPEELAALLKDDIILYSDGGGRMPAPLKPLYGIPNIVKFLLAVLPEPGLLSLQFVYVNHQPGAMLVHNTTGKPDSVMALEIEGNQIKTLYFVRNPDKIIL